MKLWNISVLFLLLIFGCAVDSDKTAGGEDFPNTVDAIGKTMMQELEKSKKWDVLNDVEKDQGLSEKKVDLAKKTSSSPSALAKTLGSESMVQIDFSDTASGYFMFYSFLDEGTSVLYDTAKVLWDEQGRKDNDTANFVWSKQWRIFKNNGGFENIFYEDLDGDSVASGEPKYNGSVLMTTQKYSDAGYLHIEKMGVSAGADHNFDQESDNSILSYYSLDLHGEDTIVFKTMSDADHDSILSNGKLDSGIVSIFSLEANDSSQNFWVQKRTWLTMVLFPTDSTKNYPLSYREEISYENGSQKVSRVESLAGDSLFHNSDTAIYHVEFSPGIAGVGDSSLFEIGVLLSKTGVDSANRMLSFHLYTKKTLGGQVTILDATPTFPIQDGEEIQSGTLRFETINEDNTNWIVEGNLENGIFSGSVTDPEGKKTDVQWDSEGNPL